MPVPLHWAVEGRTDGIPLVLVHGLGANASMWDPLSTSLARDFQLVRFDLRGHGRSAVPQGPYRIEALGEDLLALLDRLRLGSVHICGLSLGGMISMWLAANHPDRVRSLVACCTSAYLPPSESWLSRAEQVRRYGIRSVADGVMERWFTAETRSQQPQLVDSFMDMLCSTPEEGYAGACEAISAYDLRDDLWRVSTPTVVVAGEEDHATPVDHAELIAGHVVEGKVELVCDAAHMAPVEKPEVVGNIIRRHCGGGSRL